MDVQENTRNEATIIIHRHHCINHQLHTSWIHPSVPNLSSCRHLWRQASYSDDSHDITDDRLILLSMWLFKFWKSDNNWGRYDQKRSSGQNIFRPVQSIKHCLLNSLDFVSSMLLGTGNYDLRGQQIRGPGEIFGVLGNRMGGTDFLRHDDGGMIFFSITVIF